MEQDDNETTEGRATPRRQPTEHRVSRREFAKATGGAGLAALSAPFTAALAPAEAHAKPAADAGAQRRADTFEIRRQAAHLYLQDEIAHNPTNGDEARYADRRSSFFKGLPQNDLGEVDSTAYSRLLKALDSGRSKDFDLVPLAPGATRRLVNPQATFAFEMVGTDSHATRMAPPPAFASAEAAAEIGEVYWMALCRDVPFRSFDSDSRTVAAAADLNRFSRRVGPKFSGLVTTGTLFRGEAPGELAGPYLSQFLWQDVPYGPSPMIQRYAVPAAGSAFMTSHPEWLAIQRGAAPAAPLAPGTPRYINDLRALTAYVHKDVVFQAYFNAAMILLDYGRAATDPANPYRASTNQDGFVTFGAAHVLDMVTKAARVSLEGAWFHKWLVHRRLRPEVMGGRIDLQRAGSKNYGIHPDIMASDAVGRVVAAQGNALLPQAYPEGSPLHPSYPAGHATLSGACATVLKAFFNEDFLIPYPVQANATGTALEAWTGAPLTVGQELNKLATNVSMGRCAAGIHYRYDNRGLMVGEEQALGLLRDYSLTYSEEFPGFTLRRFSGEKLRIVDGRVLAAA